MNLIVAHIWSATSLGSPLRWCKRCELSLGGASPSPAWWQHMDPHGDVEAGLRKHRQIRLITDCVLTRTGELPKWKKIKSPPVWQNQTQNMTMEGHQNSTGASRWWDRWWAATAAIRDQVRMVLKQRDKGRQRLRGLSHYHGGGNKSRNLEATPAFTHTDRQQQLQSNKASVYLLSVQLPLCRPSTPRSTHMHASSTMCPCHIKLCKLPFDPRQEILLPQIPAPSLGPNGYLPSSAVNHKPLTPRRNLPHKRSGDHILISHRPPCNLVSGKIMHLLLLWVW